MLTHRHIGDCGGARVTACKARKQVVDCRLGGRAKTGPGLSLRVGDENAAPHHHVFARGQADALLLLIADQGQMGVKKVVCFLTPPLARQPHDVNQHLREGVAGHRAIDSALHLEIEEQSTVAGQNRNAAQLALLLKSPGDEIFSSPGQSSCFSMTQETLSVMIRRMTFGVMMTPSVNG